MEQYSCYLSEMKLQTMIQLCVMDDKLRQSHCYVQNERCEEDLCNYAQVVDFYKE